jgi:hypothetical protein
MPTIRDTFERNPGLAELFNRKILDIPQEVQFPEDLIDFESHIDMKGACSENLTRFYQVYPRLAERSTCLRLPRSTNHDYGRFTRKHGHEVRRTEKPLVITVTGSGASRIESVQGSEIQSGFEIPTLKFSFTTQTVSDILASKLDGTGETRSLDVESKPVSIDGPSTRLKASLSEPTQFLIVGMKKSGKTALASMLLDGHHALGHGCYWYMHPKPELLPNWITVIRDLADFPADAVLVIDEARLHGFDQFSHRQKGTMQLADIMEIARQNNQWIIAISQVSAEFNRGLTFPVDVYLLKEPSPMQRLEERKLLKDAYAEIKGHIARNEYYWLDGEISEKNTFTKPTWFTSELSEAYRNYKPFDQVQQTDEKPTGRKLFPKIHINYDTDTTKVKIPEEPKQRNEKLSGPMFDTPGLALSAVVGAVGLITLLKGAWFSLPLLGLAAAGLAFSHRHFGRNQT